MVCWVILSAFKQCSCNGILWISKISQLHFHHTECWECLLKLIRPSYSRWECVFVLMCDWELSGCCDKNIAKVMHNMLTASHFSRIMSGNLITDCGSTIITEVATFYRTAHIAHIRACTLRRSIHGQLSAHYTTANTNYFFIVEHFPYNTYKKYFQLS